MLLVFLLFVLAAIVFAVMFWPEIMVWARADTVALAAKLEADEKAAIASYKNAPSSAVPAVKPGADAKPAA